MMARKWELDNEDLLITNAYGWQGGKAVERIDDPLSIATNEMELQEAGRKWMTSCCVEAASSEAGWEISDAQRFASRDALLHKARHLKSAEQLTSSSHNLR